MWNGTGQVTAADYLAEAYDYDELPEPPASADHMTYRVEDLSAMREKVLQLALQALPTGRTRDLPLAVSEVAANGIRYGGGEGTLALWPQDGALPCELRDAGVITDPLIGRVRLLSTAVENWLCP